jgi:hypothetical protein
MISTVSGLPSSGTWRGTEMLVAWGTQPVSDGERKSDTGNPGGNLEWAGIRQPRNDPGSIAAAKGQAVKVSRRLLAVSPGHAMMRRCGTSKPAAHPAVLAACEKHFEGVYSCLQSKLYVRPPRTSAREVLSNPKEVSPKLLDFLDPPLHLQAMGVQVEASLHP